MRRIIALLTSWAVIVATTATISSVALAQSDDDLVSDAETDSASPTERDGLAGWGLSIAGIGGATTQIHTSRSESSCANGGSGDVPEGISPCVFLIDSGPAELRPTVEGNDVAVSPFVGFNFEVMSPSFDWLPAGARFFVSGDLTLTFGSERNIAVDSDPSRVGLPDTIAEGDFAATNSLLLSGIGSRVTSDIQTLGGGLGVGMAFPFEYAGRRLWFKPSVVWTRYSIDVETLLVVGLKDDVPVGPPFGSQLREITFSDDETLTLDGIGPGLELEMEGGDYGPVAVSIFANFNTYRILGQRKVRIRNQASFPAIPPLPVTDPMNPPPGNPAGLPADDYTANFSFVSRAWLFRGAVGIRFEWLGY